MEEPSINKLFISLLLLFGGVAIFVLGVPFHSTFPTNGEISYNPALTAVFLFLTLIMKKINGLEIYVPALYALFVASAAQTLLNTGMLNQPNSPHR